MNFLLIIRWNIHVIIFLSLSIYRHGGECFFSVYSGSICKYHRKEGIADPIVNSKHSVSQSVSLERTSQRWSRKYNWGEIIIVQVLTPEIVAQLTTPPVQILQSFAPLPPMPLFFAYL